jgi:hypothetical protein
MREHQEHQVKCGSTRNTAPSTGPDPVEVQVLCMGERMANNARHKTTRMKTPKDTGAFAEVYLF